jgi:hypothetical protein
VIINMIDNIPDDVVRYMRSYFTPASDLNLFSTNKRFGHNKNDIGALAEQLINKYTYQDLHHKVPKKWNVKKQNYLRSARTEDQRKIENEFQFREQARKRAIDKLDKIKDNLLTQYMQRGDLEEDTLKFFISKGAKTNDPKALRKAVSVLIFDLIMSDISWLSNHFRRKVKLFEKLGQDEIWKELRMQLDAMRAFDRTNGVLTDSKIDFIESLLRKYA